MARTVDGRDDSNASILSILDKLSDFSLAQSCSIWIVVVRFCSFNDGVFHIVTCIGLAVCSDRHVIQEEAKSIISKEEMKVRVTKFAGFIYDTFELV